MNVVHLSPEWQGFTGLSMARSVGRGWLAAVHPEDRPAVEAILREAALAQRGCSIRYRLLHRSGRGLWVSDDAVPTFAPDDRNFLGLLGSITEIPEADGSMMAGGQVGAFRPPPPMPSTLTAETPDLLADYLLLARALADRDRDRPLLEALDIALYLARKRLDRSTH